MRVTGLPGLRGILKFNHKELNGMQKGAWLEVLKGQFPEKAKDEIKILDIGTGPGFFPVYSG